MLEIILIVLIIALDQVTKCLTALYLPLGGSYPLIPGVFELSNVHNTGAAWGMLAGGRWLFIGVTVLVCAGMAWLLIKKRGALGRLARVCLALLIAGAVGNLIDRIFLAYVRDMFYFSLIRFPVFNVADSAVTIGAVLLAIDVLFSKTGSLFSVFDAKPAEKTDSAAPQADAEPKGEPKE